MLIGAMNHPGRPVAGEIEWIAAMGLDFIDLTLEPPMAGVWSLNAKSIRSALEKRSIRVIGHTAYYLPFASPFESIRRAAVEEASRCAELFAEIGAPWMNLHPDRHVPLHGWDFVIQRNLQSIRELLEVCHRQRIGLMIENLPGELSTVPYLSQFLNAEPELGLHLDIGHANLLVSENTTQAILAAFSSRLRHVHLHDNKGGAADLHLPLGAGTLDVASCVRALKSSGYDGTITLEAFSQDRTYVAHSRDVLRRLWDEAPPPARGA